MKRAPKFMFMNERYIVKMCKSLDMCEISHATRNMQNMLLSREKAKRYRRNTSKA